MVGPLAGRRFLDLYAGSGAVGLEALSRGAGHVLLAESDRRAAATIRANADSLRLPGAHVVIAAVEHLVMSAPPGAPYEVAFLDPPYDLTDERVRAVLRALATHGWLTPGALAVVERPSRGDHDVWPLGYRAERARRYGEATLWYGRAENGLADG
jgi:16S rRNA (guanine966-N2)-methyltransferase